MVRRRPRHCWPWATGLHVPRGVSSRRLLVTALAGAVLVVAGSLTAPLLPGAGAPSGGSDRGVVRDRDETVVPTGTTSPGPPGQPPRPPGAPTTPLARSEPTRLRIPSLDVDTDLTALGLQADGALEVPTAGFPAGWFTGAPSPGELGPAVVADREATR